MTTFRWIRCECCATEYNLTTHHCWPRAASGHGGAEVTLCKKCHAEAHRIWGPGDQYRGPREAKPTLVGLRRHMAGKTLDNRVVGLQQHCESLKKQIEDIKRRHKVARDSLRKLLKQERSERMEIEADRDDLADRVVALESMLGVGAE